MSKQDKIKKIILPIVIVLVAVLILAALIKLRRAPEKKARPNSGALVHLLTATKGDHQVVVAGTGTVQASQEISIIPQVGGRIAWLADEFVTGGFFDEGEILFRIEADDYRLGVEKAQAGVAKAEVALASAQGQARIARQEWDLLKNDDTEPNPPLTAGYARKTSIWASM